jgi:DNA polymerase-3 subunit gamma/tau
LSEAAKELSLDVEDAALAWIAQEARGSLRDAYTLFDQITSLAEGKITAAAISETLGLSEPERIRELVSAIAGGRTEEALEAVHRLVEAGIDVDQVVIDLTEHLRALLLFKTGVTRPSILGFDETQLERGAAENLTQIQLEKALDILFELYRRMRYSIHPLFELELAVSKLTGLPSYLSHQQIVEELRRLKNASPMLQAGAGSSPVATTTPPLAENSAAPGGSVGAPEGTGATSVGAAGTSEGPGGDQPPAAPPRVEGLDESIRIAIIEELRREKLVLATNLEKAVAWRVDGEQRLHVVFDSDYPAVAVRQDQEKLLAAANEHLPDIRVVKIEVVRPNDVPADNAGDADGDVELVRNVFRGEVITNGGESE